MAVHQGFCIRIFSGIGTVFGLTKTFGALYLASSMMQLGSMMLMTCLALRLNDSGASETAGGAHLRLYWL